MRSVKVKLVEVGDPDETGRRMETIRLAKPRDMIRV